MDTRLLRSALAFAALLAVLQILSSVGDPDSNALTWMFLAAGIVTLGGVVWSWIKPHDLRPWWIVVITRLIGGVSALFPLLFGPGVVKVMAALFIALTAVVIWVLGKAKHRLPVRAAPVDRSRLT